MGQIVKVFEKIQMIFRNPGSKMVYQRTLSVSLQQPWSPSPAPIVPSASNIQFLASYLLRETRTPGEDVRSVQNTNHSAVKFIPVEHNRLIINTVNGPYSASRGQFFAFLLPGRYRNQAARSTSEV